jgi:hypothetical protein
MSDTLESTRKRLQCSFIKPNGERCKAWAALDGLCPFHQPGADENRRKGGHCRSNRVRASKKLPLELKKITTLLQKALIECYRGQLSAKQASAMASLGGAIVKAYESGILEDRLANLEKRIGESNGR